MSQDDYEDRLVDEAALAEYLEAELGPVDEFTLERFPGGHSNETLFVTWGDQNLVLRRPPPGETAESAHDVLREHYIMAALQDTDVRVPRTVLACEDHAIIGSDFFVMLQVKGDVLRDQEPDRFANPESRRRIGEQLVDRLVEVHTVDYEAVGLDDIGRHESYLERQVKRWHKQFEWAFSVTATEREIPVIREVGSWLDENLPVDHPGTLVHGDYKLDNIIFAPSEEPEIAGIIDWELSTLGDPLFDLGWLLTYWQDPDDSNTPIPELIPTFTAAEGYPTKRELVERYESVSGIKFEHQRFYRVLAVYKLAALCEMFFRRHLEGNADNPLYPKMQERVPEIGAWAERIIEGEEPL